MKRTLLCGLLCVSLASAAQAVVTIDFENDATGSKPNGWTSADSSLVSFSDSMDEDLEINYFGDQGDGRSLAVNPDDASYLIMDFTTLVSSLSLDFGNDDFYGSEAGDQAILTAFLDGAQVDQVAVEMNRDDIMNQTIAISGTIFDSATFYFDSTLLGGLIEIVDNIQFEPAAIPAPAAGLLSFVGVGIVGWLRRHRTV